MSDGLPVAAPISDSLPHALPGGEPTADLHDGNPLDDIAAMLDLEASAPRIETSSPLDSQPQEKSPSDAPKSRKKRGSTLGVGSILSDTWQIYKANWLLCIGTLILAGVINGIASVAVMIGMQVYIIAMQGTLLVLGALAFWPLLVVLPAWLTAGVCVFTLNLARGKQADLANIFEGSPYIRPLLGFMFVQSAYFGISTAVAAYLDAPWIGFVAAVPLVLLIQAPFAIVHQELGAIAAIAESIQLTLANIAPLMLIWVTMFAIWCLAVIPTCGLGAIAVGPFLMVMTAITYLALERRSRR